MSELVNKMIEEFGADAVLQGEDVRSRALGWLVSGPCEAMAVVRPASTQEVSTLLRLCNEAGQPVVPQGGLTGLVRGTIPAPTEIAISLERMTKIESVEPATRTMTVEAGVPLQAVQEAADEHGLLFPLDLGARGSCTIGGNISTNAGGNRVIRYGMTRDMVLGIEAVLADGTVLSSMNKMIKNNAGYDLKHLFIGSEGTLGIVTRAVLRLRPQPRSHNAALLGVTDFDKLTALLAAVEVSLGGDLSAFEVMWKEFYELVTTEPALNRPPLTYGYPFYVLVEALGSDQKNDSERFESVLGECMENDLIADAVLATSRSERDRLWAMRDDVEQMSRLGPIFTYDISLGIPDMPSYLEKVRSGLAENWPEPKVVIFGHLGDGNLHIVVGVGSGDGESHRKVSSFVYGPLQECGGSVSAEHGIGTEKRPYLPLSRTEAEISLMRSLKQTLDPKWILNPGRVLEAASTRE